MPSDPSQAHLDLLAQHAGFPDYSTWQAWNQHRTNAIVNGSNTDAQSGGTQPNFLMNIINKIPIHPSTMFNYVADRYRQATGQ